MKTYRDLDIFNMSYELAIKVHELSMKFPQYEMYEEGSQLRRSSKAISANIVEGYGRRRYKADFLRFLVYPHASCDECILHLSLVKDVHEALQAETSILIKNYDELGRKLNRFIHYVEERWQ